MSYNTDTRHLRVLHGAMIAFSRKNKYKFHYIYHIYSLCAQCCVVNGINALFVCLCSPACLPACLALCLTLNLVCLGFMGKWADATRQIKSNHNKMLPAIIFHVLFASNFFLCALFCLCTVSVRTHLNNIITIEEFIVMCIRNVFIAVLK